MAEAVTARPEFDAGFSRVSGFSAPTKTTIFVNQTALSDEPTSPTAFPRGPERRATLSATYVAPIVVGISILIFACLGMLWYSRRRAQRPLPRGSIPSSNHTQPPVRESSKWWSDSDMNSAFSGTTLPRERLSAIQRSMRRQRQQAGDCTCHDNQYLKDGPTIITEEPVWLPPKPSSPIPRPGDLRYMDDDELRNTGVGPACLPSTPRAQSQFSCRDMAEVERAFELEEEQQRVKDEARQPRRPPTPIPFRSSNAGQ